MQLEKKSELFLLAFWIYFLQLYIYFHYFDFISRKCEFILCNAEKKSLNS